MKRGDRAWPSRGALEAAALSSLVWIACEAQEPVQDSDVPGGSAGSAGTGGSTAGSAGSGGTGGDSAGEGGGGSSTGQTGTQLIGGVVSGLCGSITLRNGGADDLVIQQSGVFRFATPVTRGDSYEVSIATTPDGQTCSVVAATGTVELDDVTSVRVECTPIPRVIGGSVSGLSSGTLVLQLNEDPDSNLFVSGNESFAFIDAPVACGDPFLIDIVTMPDAHDCVLRNGLGWASAEDVSVEVVCGPPPEALGPVQRLHIEGDDGVRFATYFDSSLGGAFRYYGLTAELSADESFAPGGYVETSIGGYVDTGARDFAVLEDGSVVTAGKAEGVDNCAESQLDLTLVKYQANGAIADGFGGGDGIVQENYYGVCQDFSYDDQALTLGIQSTGRIVVGGIANNGSADHGVLMGFTSAGTLDSTFGASGKRRVAIEGAPSPFVSTDVVGVRRLLVLSDDRLLVLACVDATDAPCPVVVRYTADGQPDSSFAPVLLHADLDNPLLDVIDMHAVTVDDAGRIWLGGTTTEHPDGATVDSAILVRLNANGELDTTFGSQGKVRYQFPLQRVGDRAGISTIHLADDGAVLLSGAYSAADPYASFGSTGVAVLLRADDSGALDASFGRGGFWTSHPNGSWDFGSLNLGFGALAELSTGALIGARYYYGSDQLLGVRLRVEEILP